MHKGGTLGERFDVASQANALNFVRLALALEVLVWHAYTLPGGSWLPDRVESFVRAVGVDGFFAVSGFLIVHSWSRQPKLGRFLLARCRRILPGLWVCLATTAFVLVPIMALLDGARGPTRDEQLRFVLGNADVFVETFSIGDRVANGSLWSLQYEVICYLVVAVLGVCAVRGRARRALLGFMALCWIMSFGWAWFGLVDLDGELPLLSRTGLMFGCGAAFHIYRDRIRFDRGLALVATFVVLVSWVSPDYRLVAAPALTYVLLYAGISLGRYQALRLRADLSYGTYLYGFPVQQALVAGGLGSLPFLVFLGVSALAVLPVAAVSWFLVEKPILRFRHRRRVVEPAADGRLATEAATGAASL